MARRVFTIDPFVIKFLIWLCVAASTGAIAGALSGVAVSSRISPTITISRATSTTPVATSTRSTTESPSLVTVTPSTAFTTVPPAALLHRASPAALIYRRARGVLPEDRTLSPDRLLGSAVSLTADGWVVTAASVIGMHPLADLTVVMDGKSYAVQRGLIDHLNNTVYLDVDASALPTPAFGDVSSLVRGAETWVERRSGALVPALIQSLQDRMTADPVLSDIAERRVLLTGVAMAGDAGAPVWDDRGTLLGIIESAAGEPYRIVPASSLSSSFSSVLTNGEIRHARLGVRSIDLSAWIIDGDRGTYPQRGALLKDDKKSGRTAIVKDSPAAKAGLIAGDVILRVEHDMLDGTADLGEILSEYRPSAEVTLRILRNGNESDVPVMLASFVSSEPLK